MGGAGGAREKKQEKSRAVFGDTWGCILGGLSLMGGGLECVGVREGSQIELSLGVAATLCLRLGQADHPCQDRLAFVSSNSGGTNDAMATADLWGPPAWGTRGWSEKGHPGLLLDGRFCYRLNCGMGRRA